MRKKKKFKTRKLTKEVLFGKNLKQTVVVIVPKRFSQSYSYIQEIRKELNSFEKESNSKICVFACDVTDIEVSLIYRDKTKREVLDLMKKKFMNKLQILK